ncbi:MAG: hypothetical protein Q8J69_03165 [Sphingobacteriaceae bacterium]|nr:hypothetical protein [Sphingobacteriaceae bacterium]
MKKLLLLMLFTLPFYGVKAQLSLAPTAVYLDKNGIGNLYVTNNSAVPQEITINFQFGYSAQDDNGVLVMIYDDSVNAKIWGLNNMMKAFPRSFILPPNQQQIVRLQARIPKNTNPGTYFTRIKVGSSGQVADIGETASEGAISTRINLRFEQVIVAFFKNGEVTTGVSIEKVTHKVDSNLIVLDTHYKTTGNSPYLGKVKITLKNPSGIVIGEATQPAALYFSGKRRFSFFSKESLKPGRYALEYEFETNRSDIPSDDLVQAKPYNYKTTLIID